MREQNASSHFRGKQWPNRRHGAGRLAARGAHLAVWFLKILARSAAGAIILVLVAVLLPIRILIVLAWGAFPRFGNVSGPARTGKSGNRQQNERP